MQDTERFYEKTGRKIIITGHYGSGKTEFAVSLAMLLATTHADNFTTTPTDRLAATPTDKLATTHANNFAATPADRLATTPTGKIAATPTDKLAITPTAKYAGKLALIDLDIVNPYFRSRERRELLEQAGVSVYGSIYDNEVTAELPALGAALRAPLEDKNHRVIVDAGGNDSGALVLNQFHKYFTDDETTVYTVINANRPETRDLNGALDHIRMIESATGLTIHGIINNCHLLRETTAETIIKGHNLCKAVSQSTGKELWCDCYPAGIVDPDDLVGLSGNLMPLGLYMRPTWLDR